MIPSKHNNISELDDISENQLENLFNVYNDGVYHYNLLRTVNIPEDLDPSVYFLLKLDRSISLTTLSYRVYGNIHMWWLICIANNINDTVKPLEVGRVLRIIQPDRASDIVKMLKDS